MSCIFLSASSISTVASEELRIIFEDSEGKERSLCELNIANTNRNDNLCWAREYKSQGKLDLALKYLNKAIEKNQNDAEAYNERGNFYREQEKLNLALADYNQAVKIFPSYIEAINWRGITYVELEKPDLALKDFTQAIKIDPDYGHAYFNRGLTYYDDKQYDLALEDFKYIVKLNQRRVADAYYYIGRIFADTSNNQKAKANLLKAKSAIQSTRGNLIREDEIDKLLRQIL